MTAIGRLDRLLSIERNTPTTNDLNEEVDSWAEAFKTWAERKDVSDGESVAAGVLGSSQMSRFVIRSDSLTRTITPKDRISYDGDLWNIKGVKETNRGRRRFLELTAVRDLD